MSIWGKMKQGLVTGRQDLHGAGYWPGFLDPAAQAALLEDVLGVLQAAPPVRMVTPGGREMRVRMTAAGRFGWVSDRAGYRYAARHPQGMAWPEIPARVLDIWRMVAPQARTPECCLVNLYAAAARMGLHQDRDEADFTQPVVSVSLGDDALFRIGTGTARTPTRSLWLRSGDVLALEGPSRLAFHGIDRLRPGSSQLIPGGGRINLTLRVVT